jgi:glycine cleavage system aminomethyltransferase T
MTDMSTTRSEIRRLIALRYYDGPTQGLVLLAIDGRDRTFIFEMISWDDSQDRRVFALCEIEDGAALDRVSSVAGPPKWPIWVPDWKFRSDKERANADEVVDHIMAQKTDYDVVMCAPDSMSGVEIRTDLGAVHRDLLRQFDQSRQLQPFEAWKGLYRM